MLNRIMLVEDSEGEALLVKQRLRLAGFEDPLYHLVDAEEALKYLQGEGRYADRHRFPIPEILLLDLSMPKVDGFQILKWIRSQAHLAPMVVVTLTGEMDPKRLALAYQLGANSYLAKDGSIAEYREFVRFFTSYAAITKRDMVDGHGPTLSLPVEESGLQGSPEADDRSAAGAA